MKPDRLERITEKYRQLRIAIVGDFCLDRYLEIDPDRQEISIETGLPVHNVVNIRSQPGAAGTILNNLVALGIQEIYPVGFAGDDGEGFELARSLAAKRGVRLDHFFRTELCRTFTYTKPLIVQPGKVPEELNRLDFKNWSPTPAPVRQRLCQSVAALAGQVDAVILLDQVDLTDTGVVTRDVLNAVESLTRQRQELFVIADSRRSLKDFPAVAFKMNEAEFKAMTGTSGPCPMQTMENTASTWAKKQRRHVFVTLAERGILGASPEGLAQHIPALPLRGEIDIVGAGDAVTANLTAALSAQAQLGEALELAMLAASIVVHQLGTTGTASIQQLQALRHGN